ncbi:hypothetical protein PILCRDRAFT_76914 [Piloderma croceum F 1598]|uniref:AB hydrolase-1 domain-containing protein n=1 Tax=Piloderma croceum (strain F 1598) TaxID=765440 RepID=A0A0C3FBV4_PILCF|nr:hypothetical protein PILCRDRAFT_76914 [Piloderma croceum F 1598]
MAPCLTLTLPLVIIPFLLMLYTLSNFPNTPQTLPSVYHSLASLPKPCRSWDVYPDDFYPGGEYVTFPQGRTRYWLIGPEKGKKIILIHGLSIPSLVYRDVAPILASKGYRILLYDLYGRGYSDAPQTVYDTSLYATQFALLMQHVGWERAGVVGVSMGASIAVAVSDLFPQLISGKVALIASAGLLESNDISRTVKFMSSPLVQSFASSFPFRRYVSPPTPSHSPAPQLPHTQIVRLQSAHLPGYNRALASSIRFGPIRGQSSSYTNLAKSGRSVLLIHGTEDRTVPYKYASTIQAHIPSSELLTVSGAGHDITVTHSELVTEALLKFFGMKDSWVLPSESSKT